MARFAPLAIQLAERLAASITAGHYPVGSKFPTLTQIERSEGCSRSTVQRALAILTDRGLVAGHQGVGIFVRGTPDTTKDVPPFELSAGRRDGHLYVIAFTSGVTKVGFTVDPAVRIKTHATEARRRFDSIGRPWVSQPHPRAAELEAVLLAFARERFKVAFGDEYFRSADFDVLVGHAESLLGEAPQPDLLDLLAA